MTPAERRFENNKLVSFAIVIGVVVIALSQFTEALQKLRALLFPHPKPNVTLAEANNWKKGPPPIAAVRSGDRKPLESGVRDRS